MKVLWFANTPCGAIEKLSTKNLVGGWLISLEKELKQYQSIELFVCFYTEQNLSSFNYKSVSYYPIYRRCKSSRIMRYLSRLFDKTKNDKLELQKLIEVINDIHPDIIHVHGTEENFGIILNHTQIPVVISMQGILSSITEKNFSGIPIQLIQKYEGLKDKIFLKSERWLFINMKKRASRERIMLENSKFIIGRTDWDKRITRILAPKSQYFVLNEILREPFYTNEFIKHRFNKKLKIITITSNAIYKGFETIAKTAKILSSLHSIDFEWQIIGININSKIVRITKKWLKLNYRSINLMFLGNKNEEELLKILSSSDIYCQASHIENSSNSLCEAMILGLPIVASFVGGTDSLLENRKEGILVQDGDPYSLAGAIVEIAMNYDVAIQYALAARDKALKRHDKRYIVSELVKIYESIKSNETSGQFNY